MSVKEIMNIKDAIERVNQVMAHSNGEVKTLLNLSVKALSRSGADELRVTPRLENLLQQESLLNNITEEWAENVYIQALAMKRRLDCKEYLKTITLDTQSMWVSIISAIIGLVATAVIAVLLMLDIIDEVNVDNLAYIIALGGWLVTIVVTVVARIINTSRAKKHDENSDFTIAELMAVKYEGSNNIVKWLSRPYVDKKLMAVEYVYSNKIGKPMPDVDKSINIGKIVGPDNVVNTGHIGEAKSDEEQTETSEEGYIDNSNLGKYAHGDTARHEKLSAFLNEMGW